MTPRVQGATRRIRVVAALLIVGLAAGPAASHLYWLLGGTWGLYTRGVRDEVATTGVRVVPPSCSCCSSRRCWSSWRGSGCGSRRSYPTG